MKIADAMLTIEDKIESKETILTSWYVEIFPDVAAYIRARGGNLEEAKEIFQEALIRYYEKITLDEFQPVVSDKAYVMGIVKNLWFKSREKRIQFESIEQMELQDEPARQGTNQKLLQFLKQAGEKCMDLLQSFYYENLSMSELSDRFGYRSERSATVQKYKCLEKIREEVKQKSLTYEDFFD